MSLILKISSLIFLLMIILLVLILVKKDRLSVKYSLVWLISFVLLFFFTSFPGFLSWTTDLLGFETPSNMIFALLIALLVIISIMLTVIVSKQKEQIRLLVEEISLLKKEVKYGDKK